MTLEFQRKSSADGTCLAIASLRNLSCCAAISIYVRSYEPSQRDSANAPCAIIFHYTPDGDN